MTIRASEPGRQIGDARPAPASLMELFRVFNRLALHGFGGVLPWAQRVLVDEKRWLSREEFVELLAFGQLMPGPNVCNLALMFGDRYFGWRGAVTALAGMLLLPCVLVLGLLLLHAQFAQIPAVQRAVSGMGAVAAGLLMATAVKLVRSQLARWRWLFFGLVAFIGVGLLRWPLVTVLALSAPVAVALAWWHEPAQPSQPPSGKAPR